MFLRSPRFVFPFLMALFMSFLMSGFITFINLGISANFPFIWMKNWIFSLSISFPAAFFVAPIVQKVTAKICKK